MPAPMDGAAGLYRWFDRFLPYVSGDDMGEHWLANFALLALDRT